MSRIVSEPGQWFNLDNTPKFGVAGGYAEMRQERVWDWLRPYRHPRMRRGHPVTHSQHGAKQWQLHCAWCGATRVVSSAAARDAGLYSEVSSFYAEHGAISHQVGYSGLRPARLPARRVVIRRTSLDRDA